MRDIVKKARTHAALSITTALLGATAVGCLDRDVARQLPNSTTTIALNVSQEAVDKIDLLFMIDNSASMGDKQNYVIAAIPDLVKRLAQPNCLMSDGVTPDQPSSPDGMGTCPDGETVEFPPVHNMHLGIVTSSLGTRGGDICQPAKDGPLDAHEDDRGELINRGGTAEAPVDGMSTSNFLTWFPPSAPPGDNPGGSPTTTDATTLSNEFIDLVSGVHEGGCGIESQLESWYRFLIQPDPYDSIDSSSGRAVWQGVDSTIIRQRHDFLRPDSLVAIVDVTDENDSEIDVRSIGQQAYNWMLNGSKLPRGTTACATNPGDPACTVCQGGSTDPACLVNGGVYTDEGDWGMNPNLRHVHMKQKYGVDVQFPLSRYVNGLTSATVPNSVGEYPSDSMNNVSPWYVGTNNCTNPLFAASLPDGSKLDSTSLCSLTPGARPKNFIFYAHIGGVPYQLLHYTPNDPQASMLQPQDWVNILGKNPDAFDYTGIDPHMIESYTPRAGLPGADAGDQAADDTDMIPGREWVTNMNHLSTVAVDLQFACTFELPKAHDCTSAAYSASCDCPTTPGAAWPATVLPPVCGGPQASNAIDQALPQTTQVRAKAYPTIRETELVQKLGGQGVLASICPKVTIDNAAGNDPEYGYRPAVASLVDRLKSVLSAECLPEKLTAQMDGTYPCDILEVLPTPEDTCANEHLLPAPADEAAKFKAQLQAAETTNVGVPGKDISLNTVCTVPALTQSQNPTDFTSVNGSPTCKASSAPGWCYVTGAAAGSCDQAVGFTKTAVVPGAQISLQCLENSVGAADAGTDSGTVPQ